MSQLLNGTTFSISEETATGENWIDGKKIYRRTIMTTDTIPAGSSLTIPLSLPAGATVWIDTQNSYIRTPNGSISYPLPLTAYGGDANENVYAWVNTAGIRLGSSRGAWGVGWEKVVTIRYTR